MKNKTKSKRKVLRIRDKRFREARKMLKGGIFRKMCRSSLVTFNVYLFIFLSSNILRIFFFKSRNAIIPRILLIFPTKTDVSSQFKFI